MLKVDCMKKLNQAIDKRYCEENNSRQFWLSARYDIKSVKNIWKFR